MTFHRKKTGTALIVGALLCTTGDTAHVAFQVDGYPPSPLNLLPFGVPIWVPLEFGLASVAMMLSHDYFLRKDPDQKPTSVFQVGMSALYFVGLYGFIAVSDLSSGGMKDVVMVGFALGLWFLMRSNLRLLGLALSTAGVGTLFEIAFVKAGGFYYYPASANLFGVPSWLPWLYFTASLATSSFVKF